MYPQVILLGIASVKNDFGVKKYIMPLSIIGLLISIYHYMLQMSPIPLPCSDEVANCALKQISYFGYITIPLMAGTAFVVIISLMILVKIRGKN
jgi:disulfide bond formation protein DsbB